LVFVASPLSLQH